MLDLDYIRAQFPAFATPSLQGQAFFENAGGSYACQPVIDRMMRFYTERKVQPYAPYAAATLGGAEMDEARARLAALMGVEAAQVSFGPSTTQNVYVLAQAAGGWLQPGDAIVVTNQDHEANTGAWRRLADRGIVVREWQVDPDTGHLDAADLPNLLDGAKILCFPHCSNVVGEINDVAAICALARDAGVLTCVDGVSYAPHGIPDVGALGPDIYMFSSYKTYGPHQGIMVLNPALGTLWPNQAHHFNADYLEKRFTPAGPDHAQVAACAGMVDYLEGLARHHGASGDTRTLGHEAHDLMRDHEVALLQPLLDYVADRNSLRLLGPRDAARRAPTVAVAAAQKGEALAEKLVKHGIMAGGGDFYAVRPLRAMGIDPGHGVLRLSFVHYTSPAEIDQLIAALEAEI